MNKEEYEMLYALLWKEYKIHTGRSHNLEGYRYTRKDMPAPEDKEIRRRTAVLYDLLYRRGSWLNIFDQEDSKVIYNGQDFYASLNSETNCEKYLEKGTVYTLKKINPCEELAIVELTEFPGMKFEASSFFYLENRDKSEEELLEEYGPALQDDLKRMDEINEEIDKLPKLTVTEELQQFYEEVKDSNNCDALDEMIYYINPEECVSEFNVGDCFYDGGRTITILCISNELNKANSLTYFCKVVEDNKGLTWYSAFEQDEMEVIKITDVKLDENTLSEKLKLIRKIMLVTGGVMWTFALLAPKEQISLEDARRHKYNTGDLIVSGTEKEEIICVSPTPDCDNNWIYFCGNNSLNSENQTGYQYYTIYESAE